MRNYEASSAVDSAKIWIGILSWGAIIIGLILLFVGIAVDDIAPGAIVVGAGISGLIFKSLVKGLYVIVCASEIYIAEHKKEKTLAE
jgi:hypothetical protein